MHSAAEGHDISVRGFECLGACDIAPMASVNGEYVGPLNLDDASLIVEDLDAGRPVLEHKQLRNRACADPGAAND
jgi:NADH:ubiquinone oxidoreductase subunit E